MPSTGFNDPDNENSSGLTKNPSNIDCLADLLKDAMVVPTPMPHNRHSAAPQVTSVKLPWNGTWNANLMRSMQITTIRHSIAKSGAILAITISAVLAGSISNCSSIPHSRSRIMVVSDTSDALSSRRNPNTTVTRNQEPSRPGL